jgi:hypothetical protein
VGASIVRWAIFGVGLPLVPILVNGLDAITGSKKHFHFEALFEQGELLLVSAAVVGAALAELVRGPKPLLHTLRLSAGSFAVLVLLGTSVWFAEIATHVRAPTYYNHHTVALGSMLMFGISLLAGVACIVVGELAEGGG